MGPVFWCILLAFVGHRSAAQLIASFGPQFGPIEPQFGPIDPFFAPPPFITVFVFPPVTLQAKAGGGLRASIPDDCGVESFEFESRKGPKSPWKGKNVTSKTEGNWIFDDPSIVLTPGETIFYRCGIVQRGSYYTKPDAEWIVPGLTDEFDPPKPPKSPEDCPEDKMTPKPNVKKEETTPQPDEEETTDDGTTDSTDSSTQDPSEMPEEQEPEEMEPKKPNKPKTGKPKKQNAPKMPNKPKEPTTSLCPPPGPEPGESREDALERKLAKVQCDMLQLAERTFQVNQALSLELLELKKLNYAVVSRIQRLETLLMRNLNPLY
ncbi:bacteria Hypothetical protein protein [Nesidiocoris tenuis]|uniref:CBM39 domain-containing protein n=1 Tax=Nesidiocoris tenuis TaxID=355587 RepID=A0ABN7AC63_9HEMI|nr:bacteria Hypothetical protein protein [Nesidiocoris tenuis]